MSQTAAAARRMLESTGTHPVASLFIDLDPSEFATATVRASLLDGADGDGHAALLRF